MTGFCARRSVRWISCALLCLVLSGFAMAGDLRIRIPKRTKPTPVQKLNQEGVEAIEKRDYTKARKLFYEAYLLDPDDPFTLNNLGYIAELNGEIERAQRYYALAADQRSEAVVDRASNETAKGKPVNQVAGSAGDDQMKVNRLNVYAIGLLEKDRAPEADITLQKALAIDPKNPFTLNNMGYAKEKQGELHEAYKHYSQAANSGSNEAVIVSVRPGWRGKPISEVAANNARLVQRLIARGESVDSQVARLNVRGVAALNRNDRALARKYFQEAYKLAPGDAFTLNNMGYLAEMEGDRETADFFYQRAQESTRSGSRVVYATRKEAEGLPVSEVAQQSDAAVSAAQEASVEARRREGRTVQLKRRDGAPIPPPQAAQQPAQAEPNTSPQNSNAETPQE